jgi:Heterokaryon incompatibility protein (HET)
VDYCHDIYKFSSLPEEGLSIRLLCICPTLDITNGFIRCYLKVIRLDAGVQYEALSYCWGGLEGTEQIYVDGRRFTVTKNLLSALSVLRNPDAPRDVWIDAICINQSDRKEKYRQIDMMRDIYSRSIKVIIWLGPSDFPSHEAMLILSNVVGKLDRKKAQEMDRHRKLIPLLMSLRKIERPLLYFVGSFLENDHSPVIRLLQRPWFRRIWIVQEVAFAPEATVLCGKDSMDWDSFEKAVSLLERRVAPISSAFEAGNTGPQFHLKVISETRKAIQGGRYFSLHETLHRFQPFESTRPEDKIFAVEGLLERPEQISVKPKTPVDCIYRDLVVRLIKETHDLSILLDCHYIADTAETNSLTLPSWVPDWSASGQYRPRAVFARDSYSASLEAADFAFGPKNCYLRLSGLRIDEISQIGRRRPRATELTKRHWPKDRQFPKYVYEFVVDSCDAVREWRQLACINKSSRYPTGESNHTVFWKTWLQPEPMDLGTEAARKFESKIKSVEWQFSCLDWFVGKVSKTKIHWLFIWNLFSLYLLWCAIIALVNYKLGRLSFETIKSVPDPTQSEKVMGRTKKGFLAFLPAASHVGDLVAIFKGVSRPFIIRSKGNLWLLIGAAYVHGVMYGGAYDPKKLENFCLV